MVSGLGKDSTSIVSAAPPCAQDGSPGDGQRSAMAVAQVSNAMRTQMRAAPIAPLVARASATRTAAAASSSAPCSWRKPLGSSRARRR